MTKAILIGAGFSCDLGMPLGIDVTNKFFRKLNSEELLKFKAIYELVVFSANLLLKVEKVRFFIRFFLSLKSLFSYCSLVKNKLASHTQFIL